MRTRRPCAESSSSLLPLPRDRRASRCPGRPHRRRRRPKAECILPFKQASTSHPEDIKDLPTRPE
eukprot:3995335-Alexandrium_andersonii.AAC.1